MDEGEVEAGGSDMNDYACDTLSYLAASASRSIFWRQVEYHNLM